MTEKVLATYFTGEMGYKGDNLNDGRFWYAELSNDPDARDYSALGGLEHMHPLRITYNGKSAIAYKGDVGGGGINHPKIDLHETLSNYLGFTPVGLDYVYIEHV